MKKKKNNLIELRYHVLGELKYRKCLHHEINQSSAIIPILNKVIDVLMLSCNNLHGDFRNIS